MTTNLDTILTSIQGVYDSITDRIQIGIPKNITSTNHKALWEESVIEVKNIATFLRQGYIEITTDSISSWHLFQKGKNNSNLELVEGGDLAFNLRVGDELWPVAEYKGSGDPKLSTNWKSKGQKILFI